MGTLTFDTLAYSTGLQKAGFSREQADALTNINATAIESMVKANELVTKKDLAIALAETKHDLLKWVIGIIVAQTTLIITAFGVAVAILQK